MIVRTAWVFEDVFNEEVYELEINPDASSIPIRGKTLTPAPKCRDGQVIFQGRDSVQSINFSGSILTEEQFFFMREWVRKEKQIKITDDQNRVMWVYLTSFNPTRVRSLDYPWRHTYSATGLIVSWG
jgi:hypothetical protein